MDALYNQGGSPGEAKPKIFVKIDGREWLVKFRSTTDVLKIGQTEYQYSVLAGKCGIKMPPTKIFENKYFGVERFDRENDRKIHTLSASGLLHADFRIPSLDYESLLRACLILTNNMDEVHALFRLMVFNIVIANRDDHAKNFSFQYKNNSWQLSPAYDLLPSFGFNGQHTTTINGSGRPMLKDIRAVAAKASIGKKIIEQTLEEVVETCRKYNQENFKIK